MGWLPDAGLIRAVLFDFDGTLTEPGSIDFGVIKRAVGCPGEIPVLEFIAGLSSPAERAEAFRILDGFEAAAARQSRPNRGAEDLIDWLHVQGLKAGIISRNSHAAITAAFENFDRISPADFAVILSRDDPFNPKPSPAGILAAAERLGIPVAQLLVVGDFIFDVEAGRSAGALTAYLTNRGTPHPGVRPDFSVAHLGELKQILRRHAPLPAGKLPNDLLQQFLEGIGDADSLLIAPAVGEDVAAVPLAGEEVLVLKSDPVTFATEAGGYYAVTININDIATSGATPRWLLACLLFPVGTNAVRIGLTIQELHRTAREQGLILCGGHTEITDAVTRPIVAAQVAGTVSRRQLIHKRNMAEGDRILMTKRLAIEATSIIAREFPQRLKDSGLDDRAIERCRGFLFDPGISVLREARIAAQSGAVSAMHDITEGGLATALRELSSAAGRRIRVFRDRIPMYPETEAICQALGLNPLGVIGSGSLLIACRPSAAEGLMAELGAAGIDAVCVGEVQPGETGVDAVDPSGNQAAWPDFEVDEITRLFSDLRPPTSDLEREKTRDRSQNKNSPSGC
jgi:hydrogenase expression/formation protein HypE